MFGKVTCFLAGLLPYNFLCVQAGLVLSELQLLSVMDPWSLLSLLLATASLLLVAWLVRKCKHRLEDRTNRSE